MSLSFNAFPSEHSTLFSSSRHFLPPAPCRGSVLKSTAAIFHTYLPIKKYCYFWTAYETKRKSTILGHSIGNQFLFCNIKYMIYLRITFNQIALHDGKPQNICDECVTTLQKAVELKQVADLAQWRLQLEAEMGNIF